MTKPTATCRQDPRHADPEAQAAGCTPARSGTRRSDDAGHRSRLRPLPVVAKDERVEPAKSCPARMRPLTVTVLGFIEDVKAGSVREQAGQLRPRLRAAQRCAAKVRLELNNGRSLCWRGGCIRSVFPAGRIKTRSRREPGHKEEPALDDFFKTAVENAQPSWRQSRLDRRADGASGPGLHVGPDLLRRLPPANTRQPAAGPAHSPVLTPTNAFSTNPRGEKFHTDWIRERKI